ncbi:hypothetical protein GOODEAATRI_025795, partial [Goodea atripinnis]
LRRCTRHYKGDKLIRLIVLHKSSTMFIDFDNTAVFWFLPGEQGSCAGVWSSSQMAREAGETFLHNDCQLGSGTGCAKPIFSNALVITCIFKSQLVDEQDPTALHLHPSEIPDGLAILQPEQHWKRLPRTVAHKPGGIPPREGH